MKSIMNFLSNGFFKHRREIEKTITKEDEETTRQKWEAEKKAFIACNINPRSKEELEEYADKVINQSLYNRLYYIVHQERALVGQLSDGCITKQEYIKRATELRKGLELSNTKDKEE